MARKFKLWHVFIFAVILRLSFVLIQNYFSIFDVTFFAGDSVLYDGIAKNLISGKGFAYQEPTAYVTPIYPLFLAIIYLIWGHSLLIPQVLQVIISSLGVLLIYLIAREVFNEKTALISAIIMAVYPHQIFWTGYILTETLYVSLVILAMFSLIKFYKRGTYANAAIAGLLFGVSALVRPIILGFAVLLLFFIWLSYKNRAEGFKLSIIFILALFIALSPWIIRNYIAFGAFIPGSTESWNVFYQGNSPGATGGTDGYVTTFKDFTPINFSALGHKKLSEVERNGLYKQASMKFLKENPLSFFKIMPHKFWNMWRPNYANASLKNHILMSIPYATMIILALYGIFYSYLYAYNKEKRRLITVLYLFIAYHILFHLIFTGMIRFRLPVEPILIVFSAYSLKSFFETTIFHQSS